MSATNHQRGFRLLVDPAGDNYGIRLEQTNGSPSSSPVPVASASVDVVNRLREALLAAVRKSGHARTVLSPSRKRPVSVDEPEGVRLALVLLALGRTPRWERVHEITAGVAAMGVEETYYWYAKCMGPEATRARRALRVLTAGS